MTSQPPLLVTVALSVLSGLGIGSIISQIISVRGAAATARNSRLHDQRREAHVALLTTLDEALFPIQGGAYRFPPTAEETQRYAELRQRARSALLRVILLSEDETQVTAKNAVGEVFAFLLRHANPRKVTNSADYKERRKPAEDAVAAYKEAAARELRA